MRHLSVRSELNEKAIYLKKEELMRRFIQAEPLLIEYMQMYRNELTQLVEKDLDEILSRSFERIDRIVEFVPHANKIGDVIN